MAFKNEQGGFCQQSQYNDTLRKTWCSSTHVLGDHNLCTPHNERPTPTLEKVEAEVEAHFLNECQYEDDFKTTVTQTVVGFLPKSHAASSVLQASLLPMSVPKVV